MASSHSFSHSQRLLAEALGTALLLATVVGSGIMAEALSGGNIAVALLGNTIPTGAILVVLITIFGPISGAHFNPAVTMVFWLKGEMDRMEAIQFAMVQIIGGILGVLVAHLMFDVSLLQLSEKPRFSTGQIVSEVVATFGLILTILLTLVADKSKVALNVGLYITAAYWFTASTSFANPAVTIARGLSNSFAGIAPQHILPFIMAQLIGAWLGLVIYRHLRSKENR